MRISPALPRRRVLRAAGAAISLPLLPSLGKKAFSAEPGIQTPKRMVFLSFGYGVTSETWFPDKSQTGSGYDLPEGLEPLSRHKERITVIQGLSNKFSNEAHWGSTFFLTGANRYAVPGAGFSNSISVDQVAAERFGGHTRLSSLQLTSRDAQQSGHGPGLSLAWNRRGKPIAGIDTPLTVFEKLFGDEEIPLEKRRQMLRIQRSVLDAVLDEARAVHRSLSSRDREKLDEYFQSIRDIESRLVKDESWMAAPKPAAGVAEPKESLAGEQEIRLMYDLLVAALRTDSTRVITYRQPMASLIQSIGIKIAPHDLSHYNPGEKMDASRRRDRKQSELLAYLLSKLEDAKEADGTSLLDNVSLAYGSNIRSLHYLDNCPIVIAGGGAGLKHGRHIVLEGRQTPLCNLWLTLLQGAGIETESFGDSSGTIGELTAV